MKYWSNFKIAFKQGTSSQIMNVVWVLSKPLMIIISIALWTTIYGQTGEGLIRGFTLDQTINYMIFSFVIGALIYNHIGHNMGSDIQTGLLTTKLTKPIDYGLQQVWLSIGNRAYALFFEALPGLIIAVLFFSFNQYNTLMTILSLLSLFLAFLINAFFTLNWALMYFKVENYQPLERFKQNLVNVFSGFYLPINFMPLVFQKFVKFLPFQYIHYVPARIFINAYSLPEVITNLLIQLAWILFLYSTYKLFWARSAKHFTGVGA